MTTTSATLLCALAGELLDHQADWGAALNTDGAASPIRLPDGAAWGEPALGTAQVQLHPQTERFPTGALLLTLAAATPSRQRATATRASSAAGQDAAQVQVRAALEIPLGVGYSVDDTVTGTWSPTEPDLHCLAAAAWGDLLARALLDPATLGAIGAQDSQGAAAAVEIHDWRDAGADVEAVSLCVEVTVTYNARMGAGR